MANPRPYTTAISSSDDVATSSTGNPCCIRSSASLASAHSRKPSRNVPQYSIGPIRRLLFALVVFGLLNYLFLLWELACETAIGTASEDYDDFFSSRTRGKKVAWIGDATPYFDLPKELKLMVTTKEAVGMTSSTNEHLSTGMTNEVIGEGEGLTSPQITSVVTITRIGGNGSGSLLDFTRSNKTRRKS